MRSFRNIWGRNTAALVWVESAVAFYGLTGYTRDLLYFVATNTCHKLWRKFFMCIKTMAKTLGCCRSSVDKALKTLRDLKLIAYDGQVHVGKRRAVAVYRVSGTPECPLPEWVEQARHEAWEDAHATAKDPYDEAVTENALTSPFTHGTDQDQRVETFVETDARGFKDPSTLPSARNLYRSALLTKTEPTDKRNLVGDVRREPHLRPAAFPLMQGFPGSQPVGDVVEAPHLGTGSPVDSQGGRRRAVRAATGLLGRLWGQTPVEALRDAVRRSEGHKRDANLPGSAVSYCPPRTTGGGTAMPTPFTDPVLSTTSRDARLLYLGLLSIAENSQVLSDTRYLKGELFRYDDDVTPGDIAGLCTELNEAGKIHNIPGYLVISDAPDDDGGLFALPVVAKVKTDPEVAFETFWKIYPKRQGKGAAKKAFLKQCAAGVDALRIVTAVESYAANCRAISKDKQFIPNPSVWLNQERYDDDLEEAPSVRSKSDDAFRQNLALVEFYEQQERDEKRELGR